MDRLVIESGGLNNKELLLEADRCVKCGLCLPHCPTYRISRNEGDSPRGRIALIQGLIEGELSPDSRLRDHLEQCLHCLNCQQACPTSVNYGSIIDAAIARLPKRSNLIAGLMVNTSLSPWGKQLLRLFRNGPLYLLSLKLTPRPLTNLLKLLPPLTPESSFNNSPTAPNQLFLGCVSQLTEQPVIDAFRQIAHRLQIPIATPSGQGCCGAMHGHNGGMEKAEGYKDRNVQAFREAGAIISLASGCGAYLKQYLGERVLDASAFLAEADWPQDLKLKAFDGVIAIHSPCSLRNGMQSDRQTLRLIQRIPNADYVALSSGYGCCGSGGLQLITRPEMGETLLTPILEEIIRLRPKVVVSSNTGCALHIRRGLQNHNTNIPVLHPVELIADLLP